MDPPGFTRPLSVVGPFAICRFEPFRLSSQECPLVRHFGVSLSHSQSLLGTDGVFSRETLPPHL